MPQLSFLPFESWKDPKRRDTFGGHPINKKKNGSDRQAMEIYSFVSHRGTNLPYSALIIIASVGQ